MESTTTKRMSYTAEFKLKVIKYAKIHGNRASSRYFKCISERSVRDWRKRENEIRQMPKDKRANRGSKRLLRPEHIEYEHFNSKQTTIIQNDSNESNEIIDDDDDDIDISIEVAPDISEDILNGLNNDDDDEDIVSLDLNKVENFPQIIYDDDYESVITEPIEKESTNLNLNLESQFTSSSSSTIIAMKNNNNKYRNNVGKTRKKIVKPGQETGTLFDYGWKAIKVIGATQTSNHLSYIIKFEDNQCDIVENKVAQKFCPQVSLNSVFVLLFTDYCIVFLSILDSI
ncbi:hypothetical protein BLA29_009170 [Euroglyphus maynei]|uniref:Uncharacterized protein n=1 Tax=Euroglyphus maynei TaxID=6958 RepID=A0A1Y3BIQ0_EURMA|nr:hypothetical protein BLA29_009170 [Euroglyphus maynei]